MSRLFLSTAAISILAVISTTAAAQTVSGRVTDQSGESGFAGAQVSVSELGRSVTTDRFGQYRMSNIPAGNYEITVEYSGADTVTQMITVPAAGATIDLTIGADVDYIDNVIVVGTYAAQAGAINQQRSSDSIISVIDSDGLGNFPDTTVADSLSRVPGLSIETDQGEGRYVSIRGVNTDLISSSINGVRTPSPEDRRGVLLDGIPSDLLDGIEVQKSLTPDTDGDSLGGVINLKTISAFDRDGQFIRAKIEGRYNEISEDISPKATLTYSNTYNDTFGVALSVNYQSLSIESHNNETGGWGIDGGGGDNLDSGLFYVNDDFEQRWYDIERERVGLVANFDWRVNDTTDLYLRTLINEYNDDEVRNKFEFREFDEEVIAISPTSVTIRRGEVDAEVRQRKETRKIQTVSIGGETNVDAWTVDYQAAYAYAEEDDSDNHDAKFRSGPEQRDSDVGSLTLDYSNPQQPVISGQALNFLLDPSNYQLDEFEREFTLNEDTEYSAQINVARDSVFMDTPVEWKGGLKLRDREKIRDKNFTYHEFDADLSDFVTTDRIEGWRLANPMPAWPDAALTAALRDTLDPADLNEEDSFFDSNVEDYVINERITALYGMGTFDFENLTVIAGVRVEQTNVDLEGNIVTGDSLTIDGTRKVSNEYTNVLPSVNAKYFLADDLIARAAYYKAVVRPAFGEMAPTLAFNDDRDELSAGNPDLDPYDADNFDIALEYYPSGASIYSVGVFHKSIDNGIFPIRENIRDGETVEQFVGRLPVDLSFFDIADLTDLQEVDTFVNVGSSTITGVEFNMSQPLVDWNEALDGFIVTGNMTLVTSDAELTDGRAVPFLKQSDTIGNIALAYDKGPWDLRLSANFRGDYLDIVEDENLDRYADDRTLVEASAKYRFNKNLQLYIEGKNLTDAAEYYYHGEESRLSQYDEFGRSVIVGARFTY